MNDQIRQISTFYQQAIDQLELATPEHPFCIYSIQHDDYLLSFEELKRMYELLRADSRTQIHELLAQIRMEYRRLPVHQCVTLYYSVELMIRTLRHEHNIEDNNPIFPPYVPEQTVAQLLDRIELACDTLCIQIEEHRSAGNVRLKQHVLDYIDANWCDPDLYAEKIADACQLSVKYLHRIFREYTGMSISDYIENRRMTEACTMLNETHRSVSEISNACGFRSLNTFYKAFKRNKGISPSEWKNQRNKHS